MPQHAGQPARQPGDLEWVSAEREREGKEVREEIGQITQDIVDLAWTSERRFLTENLRC